MIISCSKSAKQKKNTTSERNAINLYPTSISKAKQKKNTASDNNAANMYLTSKILFNAI